MVLVRVGLIGAGGALANQCPHNLDMWQWVCGMPLLAPSHEGINGVELSNAMLLSTWLDDWVSIPVDEDLYYDKLQERIANSTVSKDPSASKTMDVTGTF